MTDRRISNPAALTLLFAPGHRPRAHDLARFAETPQETTKFAISFLPEPEEGWLELIAMGLTFDVSGLAPDAPAPTLAARHLFGWESAPDDAGFEALRVVPGPHISGGRMLVPIIRILAGLGAELARLPGVRAVGWDAARSWMAPAWFMTTIRDWLVGGTFPAEGLTALSHRADGGWVSDGLAIFTGFEAVLEPAAGEDPQEAEKLARRAMQVLAQSGARGLTAMTDAKGRPIFHDAVPGEPLLRLWRRG